MKLLRPFKNWNTYPDHVGIDYPYADDTMVSASTDGVVTFAGWFSNKAGYGVTVMYDNGVECKYKHSDSTDWRAKVNTRVKAGDPLMEIGGTGDGSTGPHLHHEVFVNGVIQVDANYWKYVDKAENAYVKNNPSPSSNETEYVMDTRSIITKGTQDVKYELKQGSKRSISKAEWDAMRAVEAAGGPKLAVAVVSQSVLDGIPGK